MKRSVTFLLAVMICLLCLCACGNEKNSDVSLYDLSRAMLSATEFGEMNYVSSTDENAKDLFSYVSDMDYEKVDSYFLSYAKDGKGNADEIAVIRVKDKADLDTAVKSLNSHLQKRINLYRTYDPAQSARIEKGEVFTESGLAILIVSEDNAAVKNACIAALHPTDGN